MENPTKYHMLESQRRQVKEYLSESPGRSTDHHQDQQDPVAGPSGTGRFGNTNLLSPPEMGQQQHAKSAPDYQQVIKQ